MSLETICFWILEMKYSFKTPLGTVIKKQFKSTEVICYDYLAIILKKTHKFSNAKTLPSN